MRKRVQLTATTMRARPLSYKTELVKAFMDNALPSFRTGALAPVVDTEFPLEKVQEAHEYMEGNKNIGKVLIRVKQ